MSQNKNVNAAIGCVMAFFQLFITTPSWYYLLYQILVRVEATELMWFIFWVYVPVSWVSVIVNQIIAVMLRRSKDV